MYRDFSLIGSSRQAGLILNPVKHHLGFVYSSPWIHRLNAPTGFPPPLGSRLSITSPPLDRLINNFTARTMILGWLYTVALLGLASAVPPATRWTREEPLPPDVKFSLVAVRSGSDVDADSFQAAGGRLSLDLPSQNASCDGQPAESATFYLHDGTLYLYNDATIQQLYTDRSWMGMPYNFLSLSPPVLRGAGVVTFY